MQVPVLVAPLRAVVQGETTADAVLSRGVLMMVAEVCACGLQFWRPYALWRAYATVRVCPRQQQAHESVAPKTCDQHDKWLVLAIQSLP